MKVLYDCCRFHLEHVGGVPCGICVGKLANELIPVEIKANQNQAKSLVQLVRSDRYPDIRMASNSQRDVDVSLPLVSFPFFCLFLHATADSFPMIVGDLHKSFAKYLSNR